MSTIIDGTAGITFPDASTQSKAVSQVTPFAVTASAIAGAELQLPEATANGVNYVAVKAPTALSANTTFTLPSADGTSGQVLQTNASGVLAFGNVAVANGGTGLTSPGTAGNVLTSNGTGWTSAAPASGSILRVAVFTSSGTWTKGAGTNYIKVRGVGGGGGGGGGRNGSGSDCGAGGGAGGYAEEFINTSGVTTVSVTIGSIGAGGASDTSGSTGGTTTFGAYFTCNGGVGGGPGASNVNIGGDGGTATGGDLNVKGGGGNAGGVLTRSGPSGLGGSSAFGGGGSGVVPDNNGTSGRNGNAYGSGGSGGAGNFSGAGGTGGNGVAGVVIVEEYA